MSNLNQEQLSLLHLHTYTVGSQKLKELKSAYGSYQAALAAVKSGRCLIDLTTYQKKEIIAKEQLVPKLTKIIEHYQIKLIEPELAEYPLLFNEMSDYPAVIYLRGQLPVASHYLAIVGSRNYSVYGQTVTEELTKEAVSLGLCIVSGLARGIDSIAHQTCLEAGGQTIAVLGRGVEQIYPASNTGLADQIIKQGGAVISEFPLLTPSYKVNFPVRNRIIAGLSDATLIIEAARDSGALSTAGYTNQYNRTLMVVPGDIDRETAGGVNQYLVKGTAGAVSRKEDIAYHLNLSRPEFQKRALKLASDEQAVIDKIPKTGVHLDRLATLLNLDIATLSSKVIMLELKGVIRQTSPGYYRLL